jgi:hypothetical protein
MSTTKLIYQCKNCQQLLASNQEVCPACNSTLKNISLCVTDKIEIKESFSLKKFTGSSKKFLVHLKQGWFESIDKEKHPKGVRIRQLVDRERDLYIKKVDDEKTGVTTKDLTEPLSKH